MKRTLIYTLLFAISFFLASCGDTTQDAEPDPETLEFAVEPTEDLSFMVNEAPGDFTWDFFQDNIIVTAIPSTNWSGEIILSSFQVENGEVVNRATSDAVETSMGELADGISTEELWSGSEWVPGDQWFPGSQWFPDSKWSPAEIEEIALSEFDLGEKESLVVVYARLAGDSPERDQTTQPYGLLMQEEESATGQLDVVTETGGENADDSYQVIVNETTETIGPNSSIIFSDLPVGDHDVELSDIADNCEVVEGENPRTVTITEGETATTLFEVFCQEAFKGLAFTSFGDGNANIYTIEEDGSNMVQLTTHTEFDGQAAISPGGTKIAFTSEREGNREIYVMNNDGSGLTRLTNNSERDELPAWSPDGSQLAFSSQRDGVDDIFIMDSDGSNVTKVTTDPEVDTHPSWSPDGNSIAFQTTRDGQWNIYKINTDGTETTQLTDNPELWDRHPAWSPDGSQIAFSSDRNDNNEIFIMDSDGSNVTRITNSSSRDILPTWSPTGNFIGFQSNREGWENIHVIGSDGSSPRWLTTNDAFDEHPSWSPVE